MAGQTPDIRPTICLLTPKGAVDGAADRLLALLISSVNSGVSTVNSETIERISRNKRRGILNHFFNLIKAARLRAVFLSVKGKFGDPPISVTGDRGI